MAANRLVLVPSPAAVLGPQLMNKQLVMAIKVLSPLNPCSLYRGSSPN